MPDPLFKISETGNGVITVENHRDVAGSFNGYVIPAHSSLRFVHDMGGVHPARELSEAEMRAQIPPIPEATR